MGKLEVSVKRARNIIWNAAGDYSFTPYFLAATGDEDIDFYLNIVVGLVHKWFDPEPLEELFLNMDEAPRQEELEGTVWLSLEHAVWKLEREQRPALDSLRTAYAREEIVHFRDRPRITAAEIIQENYYSGILGRAPDEKPGKREEALLSELLDTDGMNGAEISAMLKDVIRSYYHVDLSHGYTRRKKVLTADHMKREPRGRKGYSLIRSPGAAKKESGSAAAGKGSSLAGRFFTKKFDPEEIKGRIRIFFGDSLFDESRVTALEEKLCTGIHNGCHLYFADGARKAAGAAEPAASGSKRPGAKMKSEDLRIRTEKNETFYNENRVQFQNQIRQLTAMIRNAILTSQADEFFPDRTGLIDPAGVWKGAILNEPRVFQKKEIKRGGDFCVTLLLDASSSQSDHQEIIASEAYILAESLRLNDIDTQIWSFCSASGFTIMNRLKKLTEGRDSTPERNRTVFRYSAMGCNRDGLALRAVREFIDTDRYRYNLLLVLTDASPNDDDTVPVSGQGFNTRSYAGHDAVNDTAHEVRVIRNDRVRVAGIVYGKDDDVMRAQDIYGTGYARIHDLSVMSKVAGSFIRQEIIEIYNTQ